MAMQVTISLLPVSLSLVHIPRSRLVQLSYPILRQILQPNPTFLSISCNEIELSLFADENMLQDFVPIARRDRLKQYTHSTSGSSRKCAGARDIETVEICDDKWGVLQIDSHNEQIDKSGARVNEVSALLGAAGISILYQSCYMSDFIFVKESRLQEALSLFSTAGFDLYSADPEFLSPSASSISRPRERSSVHDFRPTVGTPTQGTILTRSRSVTDPNPLPSPGTIKAISRDLQQPQLRKSFRDVQILSSELACVGLSDEFGIDHWGLKIVKLIAFPDLISPTKPLPLSPSSLATSSLCSSENISSPIFELSPPIIREIRASTSSSTSGEDDGYFPHSPSVERNIHLSKPSSRPYSDLKDDTLSPLYKPSGLSLTSFPSPNIPISHNSSVTDTDESQVPFFCYTRTTEGCSLTADVYILATLFPPHERHMVICSGELDAADERLVSGTDSSEDENEDDDPLYPPGSVLKCLQIDLQQFGLDKHGLVNRFSQVLEENGINHMYSSTFKTANLLVDKKQAVRARALLRNC
ncbi:hypothetical protein BDZ94DRAFT_1255447 [Collybia nuda]|uniref:CASTOR ACT domain-containing protein n=1 Tax=Collybia nuda TaxID=64659 RepID=A0A9P6CGA6_9AGAR|nr:hypothetical protein BDZ94DRAFT_1255447 [Collybia nuda]